MKVNEWTYRHGLCWLGNCGLAGGKEFRVDGFHSGVLRTTGSGSFGSNAIYHVLTSWSDRRAGGGRQPWLVPRRSMGGVYVPCCYRMPGGVMVDDSGLCCCGPSFNVYNVNCSTAMTSHCLSIPPRTRRRENSDPKPPAALRHHSLQGKTKGVNPDRTLLLLLL